MGKKMLQVQRNDVILLQHDISSNHLATGYIKLSNPDTALFMRERVGIQFLYNYLVCYIM